MTESNRSARDVERTTFADRMVKLQAELTLALGPEAIDGMTPKDIMLATARLCAKAGNWVRASEIAASAAPYVHARPQGDSEDDKRLEIVVTGGLNPDTDVRPAGIGRGPRPKASDAA